MKNIFFIFVSVILVGCSALSLNKKTVFEKEFITNYGHVIYWPKYSFPLTIVYSENEPDYFKDAIVRASTEWNVAIGTDVFKVIELPDHDKRLKTKEPKVIVARIEELKDNIFVKYLGQTRYVFYNNRSGKILTAELALCHDMDQRNYFGVAVHEFGHILGLNHDKKDIGSIMYPNYSFERKTKIRKNDIELIKILVF